jgi:hypothetical protein
VPLDRTLRRTGTPGEANQDGADRCAQWNYRFSRYMTGR